MTAEAQRIYEQADLMIVVGSRLRGNETRNNKMRLPTPLIQIDADDTQAGRNYPVDLFIGADAGEALGAIAALLPGRLDVDAQFAAAIAGARETGEAALRRALGPYAPLADHLRRRVLEGGHIWARDVTISNSTFGNRYVAFAEPRLGVHALGGGIGMGTAMAIGAALAEPARRTVCLTGDGGLMLGLAELITAVEENAPITFVLMNDRGYGVIRNIQDAQYGSRHHYSSPRTPDFAMLCASIGLAHRRIDEVDAFAAAFDEAVGQAGPRMLEIDMTSIGPFAEAFGGPPAGASGGAR